MTRTDRRAAAASILALLSMLGPWPAGAQEAPPAGSDTAASAEAGCMVGAEPDDSPEQAATLAGPFCLEGTLPQGDQDLLLWELTPIDAGAAWTLRVEGVPGARTIVDLRPVTSDPGVEPMSIGGPLLSLTIGQGGDATAALPDILLAPGRYLLGASAGGHPAGPESAFSYRLVLERQAGLPPSGDREPNDEADSASPIEGAFSISGDLAGSPDTYRWSAPAGAAAAWTLSAITQLGTSATLTLFTADGGEVLLRAQTTDGRTTLPDLALPAGEYLITLDPAAGEPRPYILSAQAHVAPLGDPEPNDRTELAVPMTGDKPMARGRLAREQDDDWFRFSVSEQMALGTLDVRLIWASDVERELCLYGPDAAQLVCRRSGDGVNVSGLSLQPGEHTLRVRGQADPDDVYLLRVDPAGTWGEGFEREPNDAPGSATPLEMGETVRARALDGDVDHFRVHVTGQPQLWQVNARGTGLTALDWIRLNGQRLAAAAVSADGTAATLLDLYLVPGEHWLRAEADGEYELSLTPLGPPDPAAEREPNDLPAREERLVVGRERVGRLPTTTDSDVFRFSVRGTDHLVLAVDAPPDGEVEVRLMDGIGYNRALRATPSEQARFDMLLGPGEWRVMLSPIVPSLERYAIRLERADPFALSDDQEPNDSVRDARPMPDTTEVSGTALGGSDSDWYALPARPDGSPLRVSVDGAVTALAVWDGTTEQTLFAQADGSTYASGPLTPDMAPYLRVSAVGDYRLRLLDDGTGSPGASPEPSAGPPPAAELVMGQAPLAGWWPTGQRLRGVLRLESDASTPTQVRPDAITSDRTWRVVLPSGEVTVPAGGTVEVPVEVLAPADIPGDDPVRLTVRVRSADGRQATAHADLAPSRDALPVEPVRSWSIPDELLGGLDAASLGLGAVPLVSLDADGEARLHDGFAATDWGLSWPVGGLPLSLTVDLAGDAPVPVAGTILHLLSEDLSLGAGPRGVELALSLDGATWETVLTGELAPLSVEQALVMAEPLPARYARLTVTSAQRETSSRIELGEWKVVAQPGWSPPGEPLDLADTLRGGHVVWMSPQPDSPEQMASLLDDDLTPASLVIERGAPVSWVMAFMEDRAVRVSSLEWLDPLRSDPATRLAQVEVWASQDGPLGPWQPLGTWPLKREADGRVGDLVLPEPAWVRFLRFDGVTGGKDSSLELPGRIRVREAPQGSAYRSILGQWGMGNPAGPLEWIAGPVMLPEDDEPAAGDGPERPRDLAEGDLAEGRVHFDSDTDWYRLSIPHGQHSLALTLTGRPVVGAGLSLFDDEGGEVPMTFGAGRESGSVTYLAAVEPGASYVVGVSQPRSSVLVSFDSSASVVAQLSAIESGLRAFSEGMSGEREALRVVPFDGEPLLPHWSSDPWEIADAVSRFVLGRSSSRVEASLRAAALDLASREGGRAVLLITDAASSAFDDTAELWAALATSRPRVYTVEVGGEGEMPAVARHHLMADWAAAAGGVTSHARSGEDVQAAFDRMATHLRRPTLYGLSFRTSPEELSPPPPGRISVLAPEIDGRRRAILGGDAAIELVVDTSGSMLDRLGDRSRIEVARTVLYELLGEDIPAGAQVALRTFTPQARSCETRLLVPLGPLDRAAMADIIAGMEAPKSVKTPLAKAIAAVAGDLADVAGPRIVVVVSDGRESCGGDPAAEVKHLRSQGVDVTLNVVGLALDRKSRKAISRLADLGGGSYFDASDAETLGAALRAAVSAPVHVIDDSGSVVARGTVGGEAMEVPPGRYRVVVLSDPVITFGDLFVEPEADIVLTLPLASVER